MPRGVWERNDRDRSPLTLRSFGDTEAAWLGAMVDAEGSVVNANPTRATPQPRVTFTNTEVEYISAFLRLTGVGGVTLKTPKTGQLPCWTWQLSSKYDVLAFAERIALWSLKARRLLAGELVIK